MGWKRAVAKQTALVTGLCVFSSAYSRGWNQVEQYASAKISDAHASIVESVATSHGYAPIVRVSEQTAEELVRGEAAKYGLNGDLAVALMRWESRQNRFAESHAGALGLMQVMPQHLKYCGLAHYSELFDDVKNVQCGMKVWHECLTATRGEVIPALYRYNGGPRRQNNPNSESIQHRDGVLRELVKITN